jgi:cytoskeleton protein RodZ
VTSFGESLKREREKRNITLDDVSLSTKIGTRMLRALEEEKFDQLPGGIFNKGFVRAYARFLKIDEERAVADYLEAAGEKQPAASPAQPADVQPRQSHRPGPQSIAAVAEERNEGAAGQIPWGVIAALLLVVALALSLWSYYNREGRTTAHREAPPARQSQPSSSVSGPAGNTPSGQTATPGEKTSGQIAPQPSTATGVSTQPAAGSTSGAGGSAATPTPKPGVSTETAASSVSGAQPPSNTVNVPVGSFAVLIKANDDSWLSVSADGKTVYSDTLVAPAEKSVYGQKQIVVRAGNVGALDFFFNGKKLPRQGDEGEAKTLTFGANGLEPPPSKPPT